MSVDRCKGGGLGLGWIALVMLFMGTCGKIDEVSKKCDEIIKQNREFETQIINDHYKILIEEKNNEQNIHYTE